MGDLFFWRSILVEDLRLWKIYTYGGSDSYGKFDSTHPWISCKTSQSWIKLQIWESAFSYPSEVNIRVLHKDKSSSLGV